MSHSPKRIFVLEASLQCTSSSDCTWCGFEQLLSIRSTTLQSIHSFLARGGSDHQIRTHCQKNVKISAKHSPKLHFRIFNIPPITTEWKLDSLKLIYKRCQNLREWKKAQIVYVCMYLQCKSCIYHSPSTPVKRMWDGSEDILFSCPATNSLLNDIFPPCHNDPIKNYLHFSPISSLSANSA